MRKPRPLTAEQQEVQQNIQREIMRKQQALMQRYRKRLNGKNLQLLQNFAQSGKQVGSSDFLVLPPIVQEVVVQMNILGFDVMDRYTKNPLKKLQLKLARFVTAKMFKSAKDKRKKQEQKKEKTTKKK